MEDRIVYPELNDFLREMLPDSEGLLKQMEEYAKDPYIPIIQKEVAQFLKVFFVYLKPLKILEIGTAIGYSSIYFALLMGDGGRIVTIERNPEMIEKAKENILKSGNSEKIEILEGDAGEILEKLEGEYDMIFLDAAKGQYGKFLPHCLRLLKKGGALVTDNLLYRGIVALKEPPKKHITIARNLKSYIYEISHNKGLETTLIPLGDGVGISIKK